MAVVLMTDLTARLANKLTKLDWMMATAESCTGGMIAAQCTDLPGSSIWFERGFVTYSNAAKTDMLGVSSSLILEQGAVSEPVARAMAMGAVECSQAHVSLAVTGIAGPGGGSQTKPVGTVWLAWCVNGTVDAELCLFEGDRSKVRQAAAAQALMGLFKRLPI